MKYLLSAITVFFVLLMSNMACSVAKKNTGSTPPQINIVLIVADDLGRNDIGCYGNTFIETPRLNEMAKAGIRFTNAYAAAPLCSPTRASIITGNNPARINLTEHLHGYTPAGPHQKLVTPRIETGLPARLVTIPEALQPTGYATAHFGKWHLGAGLSSPAAQGFHKVYGGGAEGLPKTFFYPFFNGNPYPDLLADTKEGDYLDDALTTKAISYINEKKDSSFFVELNFYAPHVPVEGKPELVRKYKQKRTVSGYTGLPEDEYAAMVESIDYNVGRVIDFLKEKGLDKNTLVLFTSDNGGLDVQEVPAYAKHTPPTSNRPLKGGKGYLYEGGIRAPWILWMPSVIKKGVTENTLVTTDDIFNTCTQLAGVSAKSPDGTSIVPLFTGRPLPQRDYFLHFPHYSPQHGKPGAVIRRGNYKLIEWYEDGKLELFDLSKDEGEMNDISARNQTMVIEMQTALYNWRTNIGAKMPEVNPLYNR